MIRPIRMGGKNKMPPPSFLPSFLILQIVASVLVCVCVWGFVGLVNENFFFFFFSLSSSFAFLAFNNPSEKKEGSEVNILSLHYIPHHFMHTSPNTHKRQCNATAMPSSRQKWCNETTFSFYFSLTLLLLLLLPLVLVLSSLLLLLLLLLLLIFLETRTKSMKWRNEGNKLSSSSWLWSQHQQMRRAKCGGNGRSEREGGGIRWKLVKGVREGEGWMEGRLKKSKTSLNIPSTLGLGSKVKIQDVSPHSPHSLPSSLSLPSI